MTRRIAACVVFFNPGDFVVNNIKTFSPQVDVLIIVDNSPSRNDQLVASIGVFCEVIYLWQSANLGIAKALNIGCEAAIQHHCEWVLTMDQDSSFKEGDMEMLVNSIDHIQRIFPPVALICADHKVHEEARLKSYAIPKTAPPTGEENLVEIGSTMTSGNLLHVKAYKQAGHFLDKLFIDHVDHEYCLRLRKNGFKIIQLNSVLLHHSLGAFQVRSFLGKQLKISNHNPLRRYYMTRNGLYVAAHYFSFDRTLCADILKNIFFFDMVKVLFFEQRKAAKAGAIITGIFHFLIRRYGKYK
jgi:rhamnosyltransferase